MTNQRKLVLSGVAIIAALLSPGLAQADPADQYPRKAYDTLDTEMIDEIVVIGRKQHRTLNFGRTLHVDPILKRLGGYERQFFPTYIPGLASIRFERSRLFGHPREGGLIELFRFRFGHQRQ